MQTLTNMLSSSSQNHYPFILIEDAKEIFKKWLEEIALGGVLDSSPSSQATRHDLIIMVDEPE